MPWYAEEVYDGVPDGEDWTFCRRVRAAGFPVKVHTGVVVGHYKLLPVYPGRDALGESQGPAVAVGAAMAARREARPPTDRQG